jgi:hypothetical protein
MLLDIPKNPTGALAIRGRRGSSKKYGKDGLKVWAMRNADVHGHDQTTRQEQREQNNIKRLQTLYDQQQNMEPRVRDNLLNDTVKEHIQ